MSTRLPRVRFFLMSIFIMILCLPPPNALAELTTTDTLLLPNAPLIITAYQTAAGNNDVRYVEIYNSGNELVDLSDWQVYDVANARVLTFSTSFAGYLRPDTHIVMARVGEVSNASYVITGWNATGSTPAILKTLTMLQLMHDGYRSADLTVKANGAEQIRNYGVSSYLTTFTEGVSRSLFDDGLYSAPASPLGIEVSEIYPYSSDCSPLDLSTLCGDYIELHNTSNAPIDLTDFVLRTDSSSSARTSSNTFTLGGILASDGYLAITQTDDDGRISLTNSGGYIWLEDTWDTHAYSEFMTQWPSASSNEQGYSYMKNDVGAWGWTTMPTPGTQNVFSAPIVVLAACSEGKYRSPETGRCRTIEEAVNELASCEEGYERSPITNRCRKVTLATGSSLTPCSEGQERNPLTNRCRSIASAVAELMPCDEGYERNPATNRCRKAQSVAVPSAPFAVEPVSSNPPVWQWWTGGAIAASLLGYAGWEWRHEIVKAWTRIIKR
ncbi:MAG: hypothetical protein ABIP74_03785 [Candidatus Saccharimonas sp.]